MIKLNRTFFIFFAVLLLSVFAHSDDRSLWQKVVDFFSPAPAVTCEGPVCDEVRKIDSRLGKVEGRYSRERRPVHKARIKKELDSLQVVRDSLWAIVEAKPLADSAKAETAAEVAASATTEVAKSETCVHDTVYVRDTVKIQDTVTVHDTVYVIVTNKPAETPTPAAAPASPETTK